MVQFRITATFLLGRSTENKNAVREAVREALVTGLQADGYIVVDEHVDVRVGEPRNRRGGLG